MSSPEEEATAVRNQVNTIPETRNGDTPTPAARLDSTPSTLASTLASTPSVSSTVNTRAPSQSNSTSTPPVYVFIPTPRDFKSDIWNHYRILDPAHHPPTKPGERHACCNFCQKIIKFGHGNTGLQGHFRSHQKNHEEAREYHAEMREKERRFRASIHAYKKKTRDQIEREILEATVCWIIEENVPLNMVEKQSFRRMCRTLNSNAPQISASQVRKEIQSLGDVCKLAVKKELQGRYFSLTTDHWTSKNNETYGALTAHYITDFELKRCVLHFEIHHGTTTGEDLFTGLQKVFTSYNFDLSYVLAVTTDTTGNMNTFGRRLAEHGVVHLYCIDHNLHLNAKMAFDDSNIPDAGNAMKTARSQVEFFNSSTQDLEKLYNMQQTTREGKKALKPIQDVKTRWWSTWRMLNRLLLLTPSIDALIASGQVNATALNRDQKKVLTEIESLLSPMAYAQKKLEGDKYPTISLIPYFVWKLREHLRKYSQSNNNDSNDNEANTVSNLTNGCKTLAQKMYTDFVRNRYGDGTTVFHHAYVLGNLQRYVSLHKMVLVAAFLDPRFKSLHPFIPDADKSQVLAYVLSLMEEIARTKSGPNNNNVSVDVEPLTEQGTRVLFPTEETDNFFAELQNDCVRQGEGHVEDTFMLCNSELNRYKYIPSISSNDDPLKWWKENQYKSPILTELALRYLAIPATSAPSERLWSIASLIITKSRTQLEGHVVADLVFLKENGHIMQKHSEEIEGRVRILPTVYQNEKNSIEEE